MNIPRRRFLQLTAGAVTLPAASRLACAETYPSRPVHLVVGFSAGSASDINARVIGQWLSERLGQPFVVDNRAGAGGNIATEAVVRAPPDGYVLLYGSTAIAINTTLYEGKLNYNILRDLAPVASVVRTPFVMEVSPDLAVRTVPEFIAYAKANPGKINMATVGPGSAQHLYGEYFKMMTGVDMVPVHYHGAAPAITQCSPNLDLVTDAAYSRRGEAECSSNFLRCVCRLVLPSGGRLGTTVRRSNGLNRRDWTHISHCFFDFRFSGDLWSRSSPRLRLTTSELGSRITASSVYAHDRRRG